MKKREEIIEEFKNNWYSGSNDLIGQQLLEVLLDIRDQGQPVETLAELPAPAKDRVVIEIGYNSYLLSETMTPDDVASLIRFFDNVQSVDFQNNVTTDRPKIEIRLVPREAITVEETDPIPICPQCGATIDLTGNYFTDAGALKNREAFCNQEHAELYRAKQISDEVAAESSNDVL